MPLPRALLLVPAVLLAACGGAGSPVPQADRARAARITAAADLIGGPKASGQVGDFLLANTKVRFIVAASGRTRSWFPVGGLVVDADRVRAGAGDDRFAEMATRLGVLHILYADQVEVANDGHDGRAAVVRVTGHDVAVPLLQSVLPLLPTKVRATTEYRLEPYAESLEMTTRVTDASGSAQSVTVGDVLITGDFVTMYAPGYGTDRDTFQAARDLRYFAAFGGSVAYGYSAPGRKLAMLAPQAEIMGVGTDELALTAHGSASFTRYLTVGTGDVASLLPEIVRREGQEPASLGALAGTVRGSPSAAPIAGATVELTRGGATYAIAVAGADGSYRAPLEAGDYALAASAPGQPGAAGATVTVTAGGALTQDVTVSDAGRFAVQIDDAAGGGCPARLRLFTTAGADAGQVLSADGRGGGALPPGDYRAVVSRGYEWDAAEVPFTVTAGQTTTISATLTRVVDTRGFLAVDTHTHAAASVDSQLDPRVRVAQALADGVELVVTTDHDVLFDLAPTASDLGVAGTFATAVGVEVSPATGHINGFPVTGGPTADSDGYWPVKFWTEDASHDFVDVDWPQAIVAGLRAKLGATIIQLNHPRSNQGILNWVKYDPTLGITAVPPERLDMSWDAIEICNAGCDDGGGNAAAQADYYSFLDQGYARAAVGVSDNHGSDAWLGRARTMVAVADDDPRTASLDDVWAALKGGRAVVLDGAFVTATITDDDGAAVGPGGLAAVTGAGVTLHVKVQAPPWIPTDRVRVVSRGGADVKTVPIPAPGGGAPPVVRFDADLVLDAPAGDMWYVVIVEADGDMAPVIPGVRPRTITNALFVDRDANGAFGAPGL
jgi:hypothetical protein